MKARRDIFQAIADPTRRSILLLLLEQPSTVGTIAEQFSVTRQAVSLHTQFLEECDAIVVEKQGRERLCRLNPKSLEQISDWLKPFVAMWDDRFNQLDNLLAKREEDEHEAATGQDGVHEGP